jgi:Rps23 Pro-64 3,4-dihydroxylase Tpa1-like proline 4-hydroxylase
LEYFDRILTNYHQNFESSFTENDDHEEVVSSERTSRYIHLTKAQDVWVRAIENRAADIVGLTPQNIEPLQIVSYTDGQKFNVHHDAGTLLENNEVRYLIYVYTNL